MRISTTIKWAGLLVAVICAMRITGTSAGDIWTMGAKKLNDFRADSKALVSGDYQQRIAKSLRDEADKVKVPTSEVADDELARELAAARKKLLDDRAAELEKHRDKILQGDLDSLKRQVIENARNAGGGN